MTIFSTPYMIYIAGAYGITFVSLGVFLGVSFMRWKRARNPDET